MEQGGENPKRNLTTFTREPIGFFLGNPKFFGKSCQIFKVFLAFYVLVYK